MLNRAAPALGLHPGDDELAGLEGRLALHGGDEVFVVQVSVAEVEPDQRVAWWGLSRGVTPYRSTCSASNPIRSNVTGGTGTGLPNFSDKSAARFSAVFSGLVSLDLALFHPAADA